MHTFDLQNSRWFFKPSKYNIDNGRVVISTDPNTDFWQRTYYGFRNDNAHVLYNTTDEKYFSFTTKVQFNYTSLFDQCGIAIYQDSENWAKAGIEFHDKNTMWLGSVVTKDGYSDWATTDIDSGIHSMWYRLSRRGSDFLMEHSYDGITYKQMRIFHLLKSEDEINFGLLACSPSANSFDALFTDIKMSECIWEKHNA
jgi:regulation of enolase protein 1 (concanavalin A-like superfamily)